ncbi:MAG: hypothetical protein CMA64_07495 [Euryarchaeota archaeon]|nr:hypothetical protein [Euryarchaeota archaeon]
MYSLNTNKNQYMQVSEDLEVYRLTTTLPIDYENEDLDLDKQKDFDHLHQMITMYGKVLFFSKPRKSVYKGKQVYEVTFGVEQKNLFELGSNPVGVLENRLNNIVLFSDTISTQGVNTNVWITKF